MRIITIVYNVLRGTLALLILVGFARLVWHPELVLFPAIAPFNQQITGARADLMLLADSNADFLVQRLDRALTILESINTNANARTGEALALVRETSQSLTNDQTGVTASAVKEIRTTREMLDTHLSGAQTVLVDTAREAGMLAVRYTRLPDEIGARIAPSVDSIEPELTCRHLDGSGYGGCARARVNGMLGEMERTGAQITKDSPKFLAAITGIAIDAHTFTSRAAAPRGKWGTIKDVLGTTSGVARAGAAVGLFDLKQHQPRYRLTASPVTN